MGPSDEMDSNLNAAHFQERKAIDASRSGNLDAAIEHYHKAVEFMEAARDELEEEDYDLHWFDLQLTRLRSSLTQTASQRILSLPADIECFMPVDALQSSSVAVGLSATAETDVLSAVKHPKLESQTREEMITCISELRRLIDHLAKQVQMLHRRWSEERDRRQMIEAELLAIRPCDSPIDERRSHANILASESPITSNVSHQQTYDNQSELFASTHEYFISGSSPSPAKFTDTAE